MLHAEGMVGKVSSGKFQWSPALKHAVQAYRYWRLRLKQSHGQIISRTVLDSLQLAGSILDLPSDSQEAVVKQLKSAYHIIIDHQKQSEQLRASFLEELAEAIVLQNAPSLASSPGRRQDRTLHQLRQLHFREKMRRAYQKISHTLSPLVQLGLDKVDVPDSSALGSQYGDPIKPKTWTGPWMSKTDPTEIARVVWDMNVVQYHQAYQTPFGSGPLAQAIGRRADTDQVTSLISGTLEGLPIGNLLPETTRLLHTLTTS
jgi:hypothetical protein